MAFWGVVGQLAYVRVAAEGGGYGSYAEALLDVAGQLTEREFSDTLRIVAK
jgi:hypothetical protein